MVRGLDDDCGHSSRGVPMDEPYEMHDFWTQALRRIFHLYQADRRGAVPVEKVLLQILFFAVYWFG